ncbi:MAG: PIN domain-containing protein [Actinomycetia bacterium]|nr:PIN domain-containing protein [Actinomycetes bacterium]
MALVHLDAGVIIGFLDANDGHHAAARSMLADAIHDGDRLAMAVSAFAECLVGPARRGDVEVRRVQELFERLPISVIVLDDDTAITASKLRAAHRALRLPDALVIATAIEAGADELVTTDRKWPTARAMKIKTKLTHL